MMKKRVITWTLLVALTVAVPAFGIFGIPSPEDLLIWFVLRPIMHGNQRAMIANQIEQLRQLVEQLQTARSQLTHVTDSVQGLVGPIADPIADLVAAPTDLLNTTRDWHSDFTGPAGDMVTSLGDLTANGESFSRSWRDVLQEADTVIEAAIRNVYPGSADRAVAVFQRRRDYADRSLEYAGARADAGADLVAVHQATTAALGRIGERIDTDPDTGGPNRSSAALTEGDVLGSLSQIRTLIAVGRSRAVAATQDAASRFRQEELRRGYAARRLADRAALEARWAEGTGNHSRGGRSENPIHVWRLSDPGRSGREPNTMMTPVMMLQLVPTIPTDPAAAPDPATVVSGIMDQVILAAAPQVHAAGLDLWRGLAAILIVWTGLRIAFTGDLRPWDIVRVVIALWFPWAMLTFYHDPLPGSTRSFTEAITDGGQWLQLILIQNTGEDFLVTFSRLSQNLFARAQSMELGTGGGIMDMIINGLTDLSYLLMSFIHTIIFELFLLFILLCLVVIYGVSMAQVLWAQLALGVLLILGPLFIPFLLVEPLAFLFWGWFKSMFTYTLYGAIAAALMRVFLAASIGWMNAIVNGPPPDTNMLWHSTAWFLSIVPLTIAGLLSSLMIGQLASQITGGGAGGGIMGMIGEAGRSLAKLKGV